MVGGVLAGGRAQLRGLCGLQGQQALGGVANAGARAEEVTPQRVSFVAVEFAHQRGVHRIGQQQGARGVEHGDGV